jgi:hypothetical protein
MTPSVKDRHGQDFSDAGNAEQLRVMRPFAGDLEGMILHAQNAVGEAIDVTFLDIYGEETLRLHVALNAYQTLLVCLVFLLRR